MSPWVFTYSFTEAWKCRSAEHECVKNLFRAWSHIKENLRRARNHIFSTRDQPIEAQNRSWMVFKSTSLVVFSAGLFAGWRAALVSLLIQSFQNTSVKNSADIHISSQQSWSNVGYLLNCNFSKIIIAQAYLSASSIGVPCRDRRKQ